MRTPVTALERRRRQWLRRGWDAQACAELPAELGQRLLDHLEGLKLGEERILNMGAGQGWLTAALKARFPRSLLVHQDNIDVPLRAWGRPPWWTLGLGTPPRRIFASMEALPYETASFELVILQGIAPGIDPKGLFSECRRILKTDGLVLFWVFGPDTLREWRHATSNTGFYASPPPFIDMHDWADSVASAGFSSPVVDMETLTLNYSAMGPWLRDLRLLGGGDTVHARSPGLKSPRAWRRIEEALGMHADPPGFSITLEVIYGHAWNPSALKTDAGHRIIPIQSTPRI